MKYFTHSFLNSIQNINLPLLKILNTLNVSKWQYPTRALCHFNEVNMSDFTVLSDNFSWCIQAIAWATREFDKVVNDEKCKCC